MRGLLLTLSVLLTAVQIFAVNNMKLVDATGNEVTSGTIYSVYSMVGNYEQTGAEMTYFYWYDLDRDHLFNNQVDFSPLRVPEDLHNCVLVDGGTGGTANDPVADGMFNMTMLMSVWMGYPGTLVFVASDNGVTDTVVCEMDFADKSTGYCGNVTFADGTPGHRMRVWVSARCEAAGAGNPLWMIYGNPIAVAYPDVNGDYCTYFPPNTPACDSVGWEICDPMNLSPDWKDRNSDGAGEFLPDLSSGTVHTGANIQMALEASNPNPVNVHQSIAQEQMGSVFSIVNGTTLGVVLERSGMVEVGLFGINGQKIKSLFSGNATENLSISLNDIDVTGMAVIKLKIDNKEIAANKIILK